MRSNPYTCPTAGEQLYAQPELLEPPETNPGEMHSVPPEQPAGDDYPTELIDTSSFAVNDIETPEPARVGRLRQLGERVSRWANTKIIQVQESLMHEYGARRVGFGAISGSLIMGAVGVTAMRHGMQVGGGARQTHQELLSSMIPGSPPKQLPEIPFSDVPFSKAPLSDAQLNLPARVPTPQAAPDFTTVRLGVYEPGPAGKGTVSGVALQALHRAGVADPSQQQIMGASQQIAGINHLPWNEETMRHLQPGQLLRVPTRLGRLLGRR